MQGKIVSISGFDGVGKTTQIKRIIENLKKKDSAISLFDVIKEDTYTSYQDIKTIKKIFSMYKYVSVRFFLSGPETKRLQQKVLNGKEDIFSRITLIEKLCEFEKRDSTIWFEEVILPLRDKGITFFFDRYFYDLIAYRTLYGVKKEDLKDMFSNFVEPDMKWFLEKKIEDIIEINRSRLDGTTILYKQKNKLIELDKNWKTLCEEYKIIKINGNRSENEITKELLKKLSTIKYDEEWIETNI